MVEPRSREGDGSVGLRVQRVDLVPTDLGTVIVRVAGRWEGDPVAAVPVLRAGDRAFQALPASSGAAERAAPDPAAFRAAFSVPEELRPSLLGGLRLRIGEAELSLPAPNELEGEASGAPGTVVDRAVLAERRARRAELAEEEVARRAEEAEGTVAALEAELAKLELRLERAVGERAELEAQLADAARDARTAAQRTHAERRRREEAVEEAAVHVNEAQHEAARLRARMRSGDELARSLSRELESLRRRVAEAEQVAATAEVVRRRAEDDARMARPVLGGSRHETLRGESRLLAQPHPAPTSRPPAPDVPPGVHALLAAERRAVEARREAAGPSDLRDESRRAAAAVAEAAWTLVEARDTVAAAHEELSRRSESQVRAQRAFADLSERVEELRATLAAARRSAETEAEVRELSAAAGEALEEAERRIGEARRAATDAQDRLDRERADRERTEADLHARIAALQAEAAPARPAAVVVDRDIRGEVQPRAEEDVSRPPWLAVALERLAAARPEEAARLGVQLLPAQALAATAPLDYDLRVAGLGWHAVTLREGRGTVAPLETHRSRRSVDFRVDLDAAALVRLLTAGGSPRLRRAGHFKVRGTLRRRRAVRVVPAADLDLARLAEGRVWPDPGLVMLALAALIEPEWTRDHSFAVGLVVLGPRGGRWRVWARDGEPLAIGLAAATEEFDATVQITQAAYQRLLSGRPGAEDRRTRVGGDAQAVATLTAWIERARRTAR